MNVFDYLGLCDVQQVIVAFEIFAAPIRKPRAAKIGLRQLALLNHRAHRPINDHDALAQQTLQFGGPVQFCVHVARFNTGNNSCKITLRFQKVNKNISTYLDMLIYDF